MILLISNADDLSSTLVGECTGSAADKFCAYSKEIKIITRELTAVDAEPYERMVSYISCAGEWPKDIGAAYQVQVRRLLGIHGKTEAEFSRDVSSAMREIGTPAVSAPRACEIALPDGTKLQTSAHDNTDYPGINAKNVADVVNSLAG